LSFPKLVFFSGCFLSLGLRNNSMASLMNLVNSSVLNSSVLNSSVLNSSVVRFPDGNR
jgi:hypothetical protein